MVRRDSVHTALYSKKAPKPVGPYSQAIKVEKPGETLYISGQIPIEMPSGQVFLGDIRKQAKIALEHLKNIVHDAKFSLDEVVRVTIYLTDMQNFDAVNEVYASFFVGQHLPARAAVEVSALPKGVGIELTAIAVKKGSTENIFSSLGDF